MTAENNRLQFFVNSAGAILLVAALDRFLVAAGHAQVLSLPDLTIGLPLRQAVLITGGLEMSVALICLWGRRRTLQLAWLAWLVTVFLIYYFGIFWNHARPQTSCIGSLTDPLRISRGLTGMMVAIVPFYLVLGSYFSLLWLWLKPRLSRTRQTGFSKMSCPSCGSHIQFALENSGRQIPCPRCQTVISLRKSDNFKISCYFCQGHIEFPAHAVGHQMACPHCKMDITLKAPA